MSRYFKLKRCFFAKRDAARHFFDRLRYDFPNGAEKLDLARLETVVVHRLDGKIGDAVCFAPFFRELKRFAPRCRITVLARPAHAELYGNIAYIDEVAAAPAKPSAAEAAAIARGLPRCDLYVHLFERLKGRDMRWIRLLRPRWVCTLDPDLKCDNVRLYEHTTLVGAPGAPAGANPPGGLHITDLLFRILETGGADPAKIDRSYLRLFDAETPASEAVLVNPYGASSSRRLSDGAVAAIVAALLGKTSRDVVLWVSPRDRKRAGEFLAARFGGNPRVRLAPEAHSVKEVVAGMGACAALVGVDTGSAHVAASRGIPELTFYSGANANFARWHAKSPAAVNVILGTDDFGEASEELIAAETGKFAATLGRG